MDEIEFQSEYLCTPGVLSDKEKYLMELSEEYHRRTESYDRRICTGPVRFGCILPDNGRERFLIETNAIHIMKELQDHAYREHGISKKELWDAIRHFRPETKTAI